MNLKNILEFFVRLTAANIFALLGVLIMPLLVPLKAGGRFAEFARGSARDFVRQPARFLLVVGVLSVLLVSGCASRGERLGYGYQWACAGKCDVSFSQADAKCTAQVNAIAVSRFAKYEIKYQCLAGEGYNAVRCELTAPGCTECRLFNAEPGIPSRPLPDVCW